MGSIVVANDVAPWLAAATFTGADADLGLLRHVLTVPPDAGGVRVFARGSLVGEKIATYDDCWEIVVAPMAGGVPDPSAGVVAGWLWGEGFLASDPWDTSANVGLKSVLTAPGPSQGWAIFARPGFVAGTTPAGASATLQLRAVAEREGALWTHREARMPPFIVDASTSTFPDAGEAATSAEGVWRSKIVAATVNAGATIDILLAGGPWRSNMNWRAAGGTKLALYQQLGGTQMYNGTTGAGTWVQGCTTQGTLSINYPEHKLPFPKWRLTNTDAVAVNMTGWIVAEK